VNPITIFDTAVMVIEISAFIGYIVWTIINGLKGKAKENKDSESQPPSAKVDGLSLPH